MAGSRHHILPKLLLKGFSSRVQGKEVFVGVYRKGRDPFEVNIKNVAVETDFYGKEEEISADSEITEREGDFAPLIDELRRKSKETQVSDPRIADFICHLIARTKHFRDSFRKSSEYLLDQVTNYLLEPQNLKTLFLDNPEIIREELYKVLRNVPLSRRQREVLNQNLEVYAPALLGEQIPELQELCRNLMAEVKNLLPKTAKEGHIKALARTPSSGPRSEAYGKLKWYVCVTEHPIILGDIGCLFETAGHRKFKPVDDKADKIINVYLPISSRHILLGTSLSFVPQINHGILNEAMARCSYEYFVSSECSSQNAIYSPLIGVWSGILSKKELEQLSNEMISDIRHYFSNHKTIL